MVLSFIGKLTSLLGMLMGVFSYVLLYWLLYIFNWREVRA
jgi:hypothetical protein